jgi:iron complex outermembrane recepter protein
MFKSLATRHFSSLLLASGVSLLPFAHVFAQDASPDAAKSTVSDSKTVEEIVVTAQRRKENAQVVPISISTVSGKALEDTGYQAVTDLQYVVPGVQYDPTQGAAFQIRGVGSTSFDFANAKSVNVVVDDVVMDAQRDTGLTGLSDIQRIDVLMGPQGTLFGKNSTSGAIMVTTGKPVLGQLQARVNTSWGERNDHIVNTTLNIPVTDKSALRVSVFEQGQDGYGTYTVLNKKMGTVHDYGGRAKFLYQASDNFDLTVALDHERHFDSFIRTSVSNPANLTALQLTYGVTPGPKNADSADSSYGYLNTSAWGGSLIVNYKLGKDTLTSITAYRETQYDNNTPADLLPGNVYAYIPYNSGRLSTLKTSQELRLASPAGQFVEYVAGLFYNRLSARQSQLQWGTLGAPLVFPNGTKNTTLYALTGAIGVNGNTTLFDADHTTMAAFGQVKLNFTPKFNVSLGVRHTQDKNSQSQSFFNTPPEPITGITPTFIATSAKPVYPYGQVDGNNTSYKIAPQYKLSDNVMVYASYSTGYKPGGVAFVGNKYSPFKAETVEALEAGVKSELFGRRLRLNFSLFDSKFTDFQASILTPIPDGLGGFLQTVTIGNAGGLESKGAEISTVWRATPSLTINSSATYTDAVFTDYVYNTTVNYTGSRLTNAPRLQTFLGADYQHAFGDSSLIKAHIDYAYRSKTWTVVGMPSYSKVDGYGLINARLTFVPHSGNFEYGIYGRNLGNTYFSTGWQQYGALGLMHYTAPNAYRTVGLFAKYSY